MPSDARADRALELLRAPIESYRSAVAAAAAELRSRIETQRTPAQARSSRTQAELGSFATGRLNAERFAALLGPTAEGDAIALGRMERAVETLDELLRTGDALFRVDVPSGGDLMAAVTDALARAGRAFGAARAAEAARAGAYAARHNGLFAAFPFRRWNAAERAIAPPLVVEVDGADLACAGLADLLDGRVRVVLVVRGPAPAAPLAGLISPSVFVAQASDADAVEALAGSDGPGVVALLPEGCARFVHDPTQPAGERLVVETMPDSGAVKVVGGVSAFRQREELGRLGWMVAALAVGTARTGTGTGAAAEVVEPADRLAAWLLRQAAIPEPSASRG